MSGVDVKAFAERLGSSQGAIMQELEELLVVECQYSWQWMR